MSNLAEAAARVVKVLHGFSPEERRRIVRASLTLLGDEIASAQFATRALRDVKRLEHKSEFALNSVHTSAVQWVQNAGLTPEQLAQYFHCEEGQVVPIALPGGAVVKSEQTANAYLAIGLASYLTNGVAVFTDAEARAFCERVGCYDSKHHVNSIKTLKNRATGSKAAGWKLTSTGLSAAAELVKFQRA